MSISGLAPYTAATGNYQLTINGRESTTCGVITPGMFPLRHLGQGNAAVVVQISRRCPEPKERSRDKRCGDFLQAINAATFTSSALNLTVNGGQI